MKSFSKDLPNTTPEEITKQKEQLTTLIDLVKNNTKITKDQHIITSTQLNSTTEQMLKICTQINQKINQNQKQNKIFLSIITILCSIILGWNINF